MVDTSAYSWLRRSHQGILEALRHADEIYASPVMLGELYDGFRNGARRAHNEKLLAEFLASPRVRIAPIEDETASCWAEIVGTLRRLGTPIPTNDTWIAAGAMQRGLRVLTTDAHFLRVPQIITEYRGP